MIVMGTHGRRLGRSLFGSVAEEIVRPGPHTQDGHLMQANPNSGVMSVSDRQ